MASIDNCAFDNLCCSSEREVTTEGTIVGTSQWGRGSTTVVDGGIERTFNVSACEFDRNYVSYKKASVSSEPAPQLF